MNTTVREPTSISHWPLPQQISKISLGPFPGLNEFMEYL